jgi:hypothetical protein
VKAGSAAAFVIVVAHSATIANAANAAILAFMEGFLVFFIAPTKNLSRRLGNVYGHLAVSAAGGKLAAWQ